MSLLSMYEICKRCRIGGAEEQGWQLPLLHGEGCEKSKTFPGFSRKEEGNGGQGFTERKVMRGNIGDEMDWEFYRAVT